MFFSRFVHSLFLAARNQARNASGRMRLVLVIEESAGHERLS
jgi:hypothetical protein